MSDYMREHVFSEPMLSRQRLLWAIATRRQLERWEPYVARETAELLAGRQLPGIDIWAAQIEHHLLLVAARNMLGSLDVEPKSRIEIDENVRADLIGAAASSSTGRRTGTRSLRTPRPEPSHRDAKRWAERNPRGGPFEWLDWTSAKGPLVLPNVSAQELHGIIDAVEAEALAARPELSSFVPPRAPSPWRREGGKWWPAID